MRRRAREGGRRRLELPRCGLRRARVAFGGCTRLRAQSQRQRLCRGQRFHTLRAASALAGETLKTSTDGTHLIAARRVPGGQSWPGGCWTQRVLGFPPCPRECVASSHTHVQTLAGQVVWPCGVLLASGGAFSTDLSRDAALDPDRAVPAPQVVPESSPCQSSATPKPRVASEVPVVSKLWSGALSAAAGGRLPSRRGTLSGPDAGLRGPASRSMPGPCVSCWPSLALTFCGGSRGR